MKKFLEDWLSHPEYWFNKKKEYDTYINTYAHLLDCFWDKENVDLRYHLAFIIAYDQIPRHIYRNNDPDDKIKKYLEYSIIIHNFIDQKFELANLNATEWAFYCLPIRHSEVYDNKMLTETWARLESETCETERAVYVKFLKATYEKLQNIPIEEHSITSSHFNHIDYTHIMGYYNCIGETSCNYENTEIYKKIEEFVIQNKLKKVIISLSGGIDSMVCAFVLKKLQAVWSFELTAVHINYCNRSIKEANFVRDWCAYMGISLKTRHMYEITRDLCMRNGLRETYETYTKKVRFQTYVKAWDTYDYPKVIMGHNYDDCFENIFTNILRKDKYENLKGMHEISIIDEIQFMRPMLSINKKDVYVFAHNASVPYLHDSTPSWSKRGIIRDIVRPALNKWDPEVVPAFFELSERMSQYEEIVHKYVENILNTHSTIHTDGNMTIEFKEPLVLKTIWEHIFARLDIHISNKSLQNFMTKLEKPYINKQDIVLNKHVYCTIFNADFKHTIYFYLSQNTNTNT